ncbi:hypothetical protein C7A07_26505, partial [Pseudomonas fragi]
PVAGLRDRMMAREQEHREKTVLVEGGGQLRHVLEWGGVSLGGGRGGVGVEGQREGMRHGAREWVQGGERVGGGGGSWQGALGIKHAPLWG